MRNEIYNRIRQNKMKFYAELNSNKENEKIVKAEEQKPEVQEPVLNTKISAERNALLKKVQGFNYKSFFKKVPDAVQSGYTSTVKSKAIEALRTQVKNDHEKIKQFSRQINRKIDDKTDKLANGVYNISSFLFEESADKNKANTFSSGALAVEAIGNNTIEWNITDEAQPTVNVYDKIGDLSQKSFDWLRSVPDRVADYLASDNLPEPNDMHMIARK